MRLTLTFACVMLLSNNLKFDVTTFKLMELPRSVWHSGTRFWVLGLALFPELFGVKSMLKQYFSWCCGQSGVLSCSSVGEQTTALYAAQSVFVHVS